MGERTEEREGEIGEGERPEERDWESWRESVERERDWKRETGSEKERFWSLKASDGDSERRCGSQARRREEEER